MKILLTNDDGIEGEGLHALACALKGHTLWVAAPDRNNSAVSHKLTMFEPIICREYDMEGHAAYSVVGTPADCVLLALRALGAVPDVVLAGINDGLNAGSDVFYSGTVAAAYEGRQNGIPSIALSQHTRPPQAPLSADARDACFRYYAQWTAEHIEWLYSLAKQTEGVLNVNFPACYPPRGIRAARTVRTNYVTSYRREGDSYRMQFHPPMPAEDEGDITLLREGYLTMTPLRMNLTDDDAMKQWKL